jgi:hypothetical protein
MSAEQHIADALKILAALDMPRAQQNERSALCLLALLNPDYPLGGASRLRERWRPVCGHFCRLFVVHGITMNSSQATKLSRNPPRHHLAS